MISGAAGKDEASALTSLPLQGQSLVGKSGTLMYDIWMGTSELMHLKISNHPIPQIPPHPRSSLLKTGALPLLEDVAKASGF